MIEANFWQDKNNSKNTVKEKNFLEDLINSHKASIKESKDLDELNELALEENNEIVQKEILQNIKYLRILAKKMKSNVFCQMKLMHLIVI